MQGGDLSNESPPRIMFVFEGLLGIPKGGKFDRIAKNSRILGRYKRLLDCYDFDEMTWRRLHDLAWRRDFRIDCATFEPEGIIEPLEARFNRMNLAIAHVYHYDDPQDLARRLAYMPEVMYTIHGRTEWQYAFGHTGRLGLIGL